ncbi:MAG: NAD-dependent epimerase/dehydratase family protein, partial [Planctomycetaceae bacterium]
MGRFRFSDDHDVRSIARSAQGDRVADPPTGSGDQQRLALQRFGRQLEENGRLPLLVTGIAGVAGFNAFSYFRQKYGPSVYGQRPVNNWPLSGPGIIGVNLEDTRAVAQFIQSKNIQSVLNCGGSCALKNCELDPAMAHRANVVAIQSLLDALSKSEIRLLHLSIDLVF